MEQQNGASGVATAAKDQAGQVGQTAAQAGGQVAQTTKEQAANVVGEAKQQARDLVGEARTQVGDQAGQQKGRAVQGIRSLAGELDEMAQQGGQSGLATEVARQVASRAHGLADHLDRHEPAELLEQVRTYARRRPVAFLAGAAVLGVLAGRLTRNLASSDDDGPDALYGGPQSRALTSGTGTVGGAAYGTPAYREYEAVEPVPAYPGAGFETVGADPAVAGGYEPDYSGGFREPGAGYQPGYQAPGTEYQTTPGSGYQVEPGYAEPGYVAPDAGYQPGDPAYQQAPEFDAPAPGTTHQAPSDPDREWRNA
ncbi:MAG TPA: hypothetical protein VLM05_03940 [Mycobacteriales bacterium]|nr:hypothetical protein [Mycobacteriales bacterium]